MPDETELPKPPNFGEALYLLTKALPVPLFVIGAVSAVKEWHGAAQIFMGAAIILWLARVVVIGPLMKTIVGKRRLKAAWNDMRDRM